MRRCYAFALGLFATLSGSPSFAQAVHQAGGAAGGASAGAIEEVVVTARRREERLQDVPLAVTAVTGSTLEKTGIKDVRLLTASVPGLVGSRNFGGFQPSIRGVSSSGVSIGDETNVALYIDGVYQPNQLTNIVDFVEVERVEVLRGPQGTLFGRNATGGLINVITPDPSFDFHGRAAVQQSFFHGTGETTARGYMTGGLTESLAADVGVIYRHSGGWIKDLVRGGDLGDADAFNARGKLLFKPNDKFKGVLTVSYNQLKDATGNTIGALAGNTIGNSIPGTILADDPYEAALTITPRFYAQAFNMALHTSTDLGPVILETTSNYRRDKFNQRSDTDGSPVLATQNNVTYNNRLFQQEVRLLSNAKGPFSWIAGGYYYHLNGFNYSGVVSGVAPTFQRTTFTQIEPRMIVESFAGFGEGTYSVTDQLKVTLGARYTTEQRDFRQIFNKVAPFPEQTNKEHKWTYRGSVQYQFAPRSNVYLTYSTGFKSGVFNASSAIATPTKPENLRSIEFGIKADPVPWLRTNLSVFDYKYDDLQVVARDSVLNSYILLNAAKAGIRGAELEVEAVASDQLRFRLASSVLDAKYDSFPNAQVFVPIPAAGTIYGRGSTTTTQDVSGNQLVRAPKFTTSLTADWTSDLAGGTLNLTANVYYSSTVFYDFGNRVRQPPYGTLSLEASWLAPGERWRFRAFGRNLTNETVIMQAVATAFVDQVTYERPTEVGVGLEYKF